MNLLTKSPQSPDPSSHLLAQAVEASQTSYDPLRHPVLHSVYLVHRLDRRTDGRWQVLGSASLDPSHEPDAAHKPEEQRHYRSDDRYNSAAATAAASDGSSAESSAAARRFAHFMY
jgi:hypothetical protein